MKSMSRKSLIIVNVNMNAYTPSSSSGLTWHYGAIPSDEIWIMCFHNMFPVHIQGYMQICCGVISLEYRQQGRALHGVRVGGIHELKIQLKGTLPLISANLGMPIK